MAWGHVTNDKDGTNTVGAASTAVSWQNNTIVGNRAYIFITVDQNGVNTIVNSITDPRSNSWHQDLHSSHADGGTTLSTDIWSAQITTQILSTDSLTVNFSQSSATSSWHTSEFSGIDTSASPLDVAAVTASGSSTAPATGNTANTNAANELVLSIFGDFGNNINWGSSDTQAPAGTELTDNMPSTSQSLWASYKDSGSSGTAQSASGTLATTEAWGIGIAVYKLSAGAGPVVPIHRPQQAWKLRRRPFQRTTASGTTFDPTIYPLSQYSWGILAGHHVRVQQRVTQTLTATFKTITGVARITATTLQTITGVARITATTTKTITGVARIQGTTSQTITGKARITATTTQTITGVARITATTTQTITGKARITNTSTQTVTGKARIQVTTPQTITGVSRITVVQPRTITGVARIQTTTTQTITGKARITVVQPRTITGVANIASASTPSFLLHGLVLDLDMAYLGTTLGASGDTLPLTIITSAPSGAPPNNVGLQIQVTAGVVTIWVWDGTAWRSK